MSEEGAGISSVLLTDVERALLSVRGRSASRHALHLVGRDPLGATLVGFTAILLATLAGRRLEGEAGALAVLATVIAVTLTVHRARQDRRLLHILGVRAPRVMSMEYLGLGLPATALVLATGPLTLSRAAVAGMIPAACLVIARCRLAGTSTRERLDAGLARRMRRLLPGDAFEVAAVMRTLWPAVILLQAAASAAALRYPVIAPVGIVILALAMSGWYGGAAEGWALVVACRRRAAPFLRRKCVIVLRSYSLLAAPMVLAALVAEPSGWRSVGLAASAGGAFMIATVLVKYALFNPGRPRPILFGVVLVLVGVSLAVPPVTALLLLLLWRKAVQTLGPYVG